MRQRLAGAIDLCSSLSSGFRDEWEIANALTGTGLQREVGLCDSISESARITSNPEISGTRSQFLVCRQSGHKRYAEITTQVSEL